MKNEILIYFSAGLASLYYSQPKLTPVLSFFHLCSFHNAVLNVATVFPP